MHNIMLEGNTEHHIIFLVCW